MNDAMQLPELERLRAALDQRNARIIEIEDDNEFQRKVIGEQEDKIETLAAEIVRLESFWTGDKLTGGSDVCHTCAAHTTVIIEDLEPRIAALEEKLWHWLNAFGSRDAISQDTRDLLEPK